MFAMAFMTVIFLQKCGACVWFCGRSGAGDLAVVSLLRAHRLGGMRS